MARSLLVLAACVVLAGATACRADDDNGRRDGCIHFAHGSPCLPRFETPGFLRRNCSKSGSCAADGCCDKGKLWAWATYRPECVKCRCWRLAPCCHPPLYYFTLCYDCGYHGPYGGHCSSCQLGKTGKGCCSTSTGGKPTQ